MSDISQPEKRDALSIACELVGRFQYHFSHIDQQLDAGIAKVFSLNEGATSVLVANIDFVKKVNIIRSMVALQFNDKDGSLAKLMQDIAGINEPHRQTIIHSTFEPCGTDSVKFRRFVAKKKLQINEPVWTTEQFNNKFKLMERLATELKQLVNDLKPYKPSLDFSDPRNSQYFFLMLM
jgi:hypothetical protein